MSERSRDHEQALHDGQAVDELPHAVWEGVVNIGGFPMRAAVLDNGQRIFVAEDVEKFFSALAGDTVLTQADFTKAAEFIHGKGPIT